MSALFPINCFENFARKKRDANFNAFACPTTVEVIRN